MECARVSKQNARTSRLTKHLKLSERGNTLRLRLYSAITLPSEGEQKKLGKARLRFKNLKGGPRHRLLMWLFRGPAATRGPINAAN